MIQLGAYKSYGLPVTHSVQSRFVPMQMNFTLTQGDLNIIFVAGLYHGSDGTLLPLIGGCCRLIGQSSSNPISICGLDMLPPKQTSWSTSFCIYQTILMWYDLCHLVCLISMRIWH